MEKVWVYLKYGYELPGGLYRFCGGGIRGGEIGYIKERVDSRQLLKLIFPASVLYGRSYNSHPWNGDVNEVITFKKRRV